MTQRKLSITETPNELTNDIDIASVMGIIRILRQADAQIFYGWRDYAGLRDTEILKKIARCIDETAKVLESPKGKVLISGAGTSGRLGMFVSRKYNQIFAKYGHAPMFDYVMSGTDKALIKAQEGAEDDAVQAVIDLKARAGDAEAVALYGVTCGFSAPYTAGQLDYCMTDPKYFPCLLGFNPVELARNVVIENWDKTFSQVAQVFEKYPKGVILNPVVGPEPITGSTRMKGGSATKLLLELIFALASIKSGRVPADGIEMPILKKDIPMEKKALAIIDGYEEAIKAVYNEQENLEKLVKLAGDTLKKDGSIFYIGETPFGIIGLVDASECPPTYGADFSDVQGYIVGGWDALLGPGKDISHISKEYRISIENFVEDDVPGLSEKDLVIAVGYQKLPKEILTQLKKANKKGAKTASIILNAAGKSPEFTNVNITTMMKPVSPLKFDQCFCEYSMKLFANAITTASHILDGKVYQNRMIDLRISNNKLFYRCIGIISKIAGVSEDVAREAVLKSVYETDILTDEIINAPISQHVNTATPKSKVVPRALLLSTGKFNIQSATEKIKEEPVVRNIIEKLILA